MCVKNRPFLYRKSRNMATDASLLLSCTQLIWNPTIELCSETLRFEQPSTVALFTWKVSKNSPLVDLDYFVCFAEILFETLDGGSYHGWYWQLQLQFLSFRKPPTTCTASSPYTVKCCDITAFVELLKSKCLMCSWSVLFSLTRYASLSVCLHSPACARSNVRQITWLQIHALANHLWGQVLC
jgi:hypothetical protein